jgi:hypothetical protein
MVPLDCRQFSDRTQADRASDEKELAHSKEAGDLSDSDHAEATLRDTGRATSAVTEDNESLLLLDDEEPLLLLDDDRPLLLDEEKDEELLPLGEDGESPLEADHQMADNSRCHHCHLNYMDEDLASVHARANIGCADCHGKCDEHIADESWASGGNGTPPEIMYPRERINLFCFTCHSKDKIDTPPHEELLVGTSKQKYCTDCHGDHRLDERKCKWR